MEFSDSSKTTKKLKKRYEYFEVISCRTEVELSDGSKKILKEQGTQILSYIRFQISKYNLLSKYQENEIFNESYERATKAIRKGKEIPNLYGWYKLTILNVVREYSRAEKRQKNLKKLFDSLPEGIDSPEGESFSVGADIDKIKSMMKSETDYRIVYLRIVEDKAWEEVCEILVQEKYFNCEISKQLIARVRQRFHRYLKKFSNQIE